MNTYKIGELVEQIDYRNSNGMYTVDDVRGISTEKVLINTKANLDGVNLKSYKIVANRDFAYVADTSRRGDKIAIAFNDCNHAILISPIYTTFRCCKKDIIAPEFLFLYFCRNEFDRFARFNSWGSARETLSWSDFCDIELRLPSIDVQRRFVDVYLSLQNNLAVYQSKTDDLKQVCEAKIEELKKNTPLTKIDKYIEEYDERNISNLLSIDRLRGISTDKIFIETKANMMGVSLKNYKIVREHTFAYVPDTSRRGDKIALALNNEKQPALISSIYTTFRIKPDVALLPEYLFMFLSRADFDRYARFHSWGSAREVFSFADMQEVEIPIPPIDVQQGIVDIHRCMVERQRIAQRLKEETNHLCPILIKGSLEAENS